MNTAQGEQGRGEGIVAMIANLQQRLEAQEAKIHNLQKQLDQENQDDIEPPSQPGLVTLEPLVVQKEPLYE